ncbi:hypothetical protein AB0K18_19600 [Nonomuraea sp. NPDC049421]|uniref:hypothetical protein n=1 Tax=Nonomuraea sp. NPDC049421 TaxID=3155275 RepID=UPI00341B8057
MTAEAVKAGVVAAGAAGAADLRVTVVAAAELDRSAAAAETIAAEVVTAGVVAAGAAGALDLGVTIVIAAELDGTAGAAGMIAAGVVGSRVTAVAALGLGLPRLVAFGRDARIASAAEPRVTAGEVVKVGAVGAVEGGLGVGAVRVMPGS